MNSVTWLHKVCFAIFSFIYALILVSVTYDGIPDRHNYLSYASNSLTRSVILLNEGVFTFILNEPIWLSLNIFLGLVLDTETVVKTFIFLPAFLVSYLTLKADPKNAGWLIIFLFLPQVVKNHFTQIRQGVGLSIFMVGYFSKSPKKRWSLFLLAPFIHSSFIFVVVIYMITKWIKQLKFSWDLRFVSYLLFAIGISFLTLTLGSLLPVRQLRGVEDVEMLRMVGFGFIFWTFVAGMMILNGPKYVKKYSFEVGAVLVYIGSYLYFPWSARIFESMLLFVILAGLNMKPRYKLTFAFSLIAYMALDWIRVFVLGSSMFGT